MTVRFADLFSGIGSFHYAFKKFGWECVFACDIFQPARDTYFKNYGLQPSGDITGIDPNQLPDIDVLCAGFPCQPFSQIGQHRGLNDERGTMFGQVMRFVRAKSPSVVILENVPALISHDGGNSFRMMRLQLSEENYTVAWAVLKASDFGIPQMRKRLFVVATRKDPAENFFDFEQTNVSLSQYLGRNFARQNAFTIRVGGRGSGLNDRHNWDCYLVDGQEYRLTIEDAKKLQGFDSDFELVGSKTQKWKLLGNTIPTIFPELIARKLIELQIVAAASRPI